MKKSHVNPVAISNLRVLMNVDQTIYEFEMNNDRGATYGYLNELNNQYIHESRSIFNEYQSTNSE